MRFVLVTLREALTSKCERNTAILDFDIFELRKNPNFHNSSRKPQILRFVFVTLIAALPANFSSIRRFSILTDLRS